MKLRSATIVLAAVLGACSSLQEPGSSSATPPFGNAEASATPSSAGQPERRREAMAPGEAPALKTAAPAKNSVYFEYDKDDLGPEYRTLMEEHAKYLRANPALRVRIEGNADERGSREYNVALGQRRAEAMMNSLKLLGVPESRVEAVSNGEEKPRRTGHEEASWAENRRGDLIFLKEAR